MLCPNEELEIAIASSHLSKIGGGLARDSGDLADEGPPVVMFTGHDYSLPLSIYRIVKASMSNEKALSLPDGMLSSTAVAQHRILHVDRQNKTVAVALKSSVMSFGNTELLSSEACRKSGMEKLQLNFAFWTIMDTTYVLVEPPWTHRGPSYFRPLTQLITRCVRASAIPGKEGYFLFDPAREPEVLALAKALEGCDLAELEDLGGSSFKMLLTKRCMAAVEIAYVLKVCIPATTCFLLWFRKQFVYVICLFRSCGVSEWERVWDVRGSNVCGVQYRPSQEQ